MRKHFLAAVLVLTIGLAGAPFGDAAPVSDDCTFFGNWALALPGDGAGWLNVRNDTDFRGRKYLAADILWYGGSVVPVGSVGYTADNDRLILFRYRDAIRERDASGKPSKTDSVPTVIVCRIQEGELNGMIIECDNQGNMSERGEFTGKKIPPVPPAPDMSNLKYGEPEKIFNGENLDGWEKMGNNKSGWSVEDGCLFNNPVQERGKDHISYANLKTTDTFEDFKLTLEVNVPKGSNSGIYLRGIYEVQVADTYGRDLDPHNMGAIYSRITPKVAAENPAGEWQSLEIILCDRHANVVLNGKTIIENEPLLGCTGGAITADEFIPGPIYLQGDHGAVKYRNVVLTPILK